MLMQSERDSFQLLEKNNVMVNAMIKRCTGMLWEGGAQSRLGVEIGQRGKPAWLGLGYRWKWGRGEAEEQSVHSEQCGESENEFIQQGYHMGCKAETVRMTLEQVFLATE